jgi:hypothetical protein
MRETERVVKEGEIGFRAGRLPHMQGPSVALNETGRDAALHREHLA